MKLKHFKAQVKSVLGDNVFNSLTLHITLDYDYTGEVFIIVRTWKNIEPMITTRKSLALAMDNYKHEKDELKLYVQKHYPESDDFSVSFEETSNSKTIERFCRDLQ